MSGRDRKQRLATIPNVGWLSAFEYGAGGDIFLMPALGAERYTAETSRGYSDGVLVGIALELYRRQHGDWPSTLDELVPVYLPSVSVDRLTGRPVKYRLTDDVTPSPKLDPVFVRESSRP